MAFYFDSRDGFLTLRSTLFTDESFQYGFSTGRNPDGTPFDLRVHPGHPAGGLRCQEAYFAATCSGHLGVAMLHQIHSSRVWHASSRDGSLHLEEWGSDRQDGPREGDAVITGTPGIVAAIRTADCVPVLLLDPRNRAAAAIHSGWRGTVAEASLTALRAMENRFGSSPDDITALVGPAIRSCCYEVSPDLAETFSGRFPGSVVPGPSGKPHLNLSGAILQTLERAGIQPARIDICPYCTRCTPNWFHSYRRDGESTGRMAAFAMLRREAVSSCG